MAKADGTFEVSQVGKGSYWLQARTFDKEQYPRSPNPPQLSGLVPIEIGDTDIDNLTVLVYPLSPLTGQVAFDRPETQSQLALNGVTVSLVTAAPYLDMLSLSPSGTVREDGSFSVENVGAGVYRPLINGMGLIDKFSRILYASEAKLDEADLLASPVVLTGNDPGQMRIMLSSQTASLRGRVATGGRNLEAVLTPSNLNRAEMYQSVPVNPDGTFLISDAFPGDYTLYVWEHRQTRDYFDPNFIQRFANNGVPLRLSASERAEVEVRGISRVAP